MEQYNFFKDLCEGRSTQSKSANQFWLALLLASMVAFTGRPEPNSNLIQLPFEFGKVTSYEFFSISILVLNVLLIAFTASMIQVHRSQMLIRNLIRQSNPNDIFINSIHLQDVMDVLVTPTYNRVAPIAQYLQGNKQFFSKEKIPNSGLRKYIAIPFYIVLKISSFLILYLIPYLAIIGCFKQLGVVPQENKIFIPKWILLFSTALAAISVIVLFWGDVKYLLGVVKRLYQEKI